MEEMLKKKEEKKENNPKLFSFSDALEAVKSDYKIQRQGWNGKKMYVYLVNKHDLPVVIKPCVISFDTGYESLPFLVLKTADNKLVPWLASQTDILAEDWMVLK